MSAPICEFCSGQGWYMDGPTEDPQQRQCEACNGKGFVDEPGPVPLLPCPFCGEAPECHCSEDHLNGPAGDTWLVCCGTAYCYGNAFKLDNAFLSRRHACEAWNTRTSSP